MIKEHWKDIVFWLVVGLNAFGCVLHFVQGRFAVINYITGKCVC